MSSDVKVGGKYLTFKLAGEEYGLDILKVREIISIIPFTTVPRTPDYVKGVINLRGKIVPIYDLRIKVGLPEREFDYETCIIIVAVDNSLVGVIVDAVSEVIDVDESEIEPTPKFGKKVDTSYITGIGIKDSEAKILLDIEKILSEEDIEYITNIRESLQEEEM